MSFDFIVTTPFIILSSIVKGALLNLLHCMVIISVPCQVVSVYNKGYFG